MKRNKSFNIDGKKRRSFSEAIKNDIDDKELVRSSKIKKIIKESGGKRALIMTSVLLDRPKYKDLN